MSNVTPVLSGQVNQSGDERAIFLSRFGGEVLRKYLDSTQMEKWTTVKRISSGKSAEFPYTSSVVAGYHVKGTQQTGANVNNAKKIVTLDQFMATHIWVNKEDELLEHWDNRAPYVESMGSVLAILKDEHTMIEGLLGARASAIVTGSPAGTVISNDKYKIGGVGSSADEAEMVLNFAQGLSAGALQLDLNNCPQEGRFCIVTPTMYHAITSAIQSNGFSFFNRDYVGADGNIATNKVPMIHGFTIEMSNHLPTANIAQGASAQASNYYYHFGDFSKTIALAGVKGSIATLTRQDVKMEFGNYDPTRKATFLGADYLSGHDYLRPECLIEYKLNTLSN